MKTCPACQQEVRPNLRVCPHCGHRFIPAIVWIGVMVAIFIAIAGVLIFQTSGR